jgi:lipoprotein-releasing system permease protein
MIPSAPVRGAPSSSEGRLSGLGGFEWQVGWRYTRAGRAGRRNGFISFISAVSMLGIALGVAALIIVLSVMNGFQKEVRDRMLSVVAHVEIHGSTAADALAPFDWQAVAAKARELPQVIGAAPLVATQALVARGDDMRGAVIRGISPAEEATVTDIAAQLRDTTFARLVPGEWNVVLGAELARLLNVRPGDRVTIVAPGGQVTPAGVVPRLKQVTVAGTFDTGHYEYDSALALLHLEDAARLFRTDGPSGVQLRLADLHEARDVAALLADRLGPNVVVRDWTRTNRAWFDAVQLEKRLMFIILTLIVAVAAFNLVSTLVMTVTDKRADIAILRTLGASPGSIMRIFMVQGAAAGILGTLAGLALGLLVAVNIETIVPALERLFGVAFLPGSIYVISRMPSEPMAADIVPVVVVSLMLAFVATLYPSWRASRVNPAEALRYE